MALDDATFERSAKAFDNPDHVTILMHNYRWRLGLAEGEAKYDDLKKPLAQSPVISVPTITMEGDANGASTSRTFRVRQDVLGQIFPPNDQGWKRAQLATRSAKSICGSDCRRSRRSLTAVSQLL
jgi:hypothetical protein